MGLEAETHRNDRVNREGWQDGYRSAAVAHMCTMSTHAVIGMQGTVLLFAADILLNVVQEAASQQPQHCQSMCV